MPMKITPQKIFTHSIIFLIIGILLSFLLPLSAADYIETALHSLLKIFQLFAIPLLSFSIVSSMTDMKNIEELKFFGKKVLKYTLITTQLAATVGLILFVLFHPSLPLSMSLEKAPSTSIFTTFAKMIPANIFSPFLENNVFGALFICVLIGIATLFLKSETKQTILRFSQTGFSLFLKIFELLIRYILPLLIAFSTMNVCMHFIRGNAHNMMPLIVIFALILTANLIQGLIVIPLLLYMKGISPLHTMKQSMEAISIAFFSKSSSASLSSSIQLSQTKLGVHPKVARFSLPLCTTINMNGCAAFIFLCLMFNFTSFFGPMGLWEMVFWSFMATMLAIGNASIPMGCYFLSVMVISAKGLPLTLMEMILPFYAFLDMVESGLNVWSDIAVTKLVDHDIQTRYPAFQ